MLDIRTIIILSIYYNLIFGVTLLYYSRGKEHERAITAIAVGLLYIAIGGALLALRSHLIDFLSIIFANSLIVAGIILYKNGITIFIGQAKTKTYKTIIALVFFVALFLYFTYISPNINIRIMIITIYQMVCHIIIVYILVKKNTYSHKKRI